MDTYRRSGIVTGILFIAATAAGTLCLFTQGPVDAPDYLTQISANEPRVLAGALLVFIMGWAGAAIGISMYPILRRHNEGLALGAAGFRIIEDKKAGRQNKERDRESNADDNLKEFKVSGTIPFIQGGGISGTEFVIRLYDRQELKGRASFYSTRGGILKDREFVIR